MTIGTAQNQSALQKAFSESYTYEADGNYTKAIQSLKEVYVEKSYETNLRLGWLHYYAGLFTESATYYQQAINLLPMSIEARLGYALPASALGHWDAILNKYKEILEIDPNHSLTNYRIGSIYYGRQDYSNAERHIQKVVNLYPFDYDSLLLLAWTKYSLGKSNEAKVLFQKVLLYDPEDESAKEGLGLIK
ncbi:MAG: tetratricopeptide repeat protein [Saprospirales bacterium]|nr:tetratricopeptide repeat protein [Saprospirales bacterium]MBK8489422.1 tetratricopeptide repeat protein [Saprospirales bacterium]